MRDLSMLQFSSLLRQFRLTAGLSQAELAERAGLSPDGIGALESGRRANPRPYTVRALADALALAEGDRLRLIAAVQAAPLPSEAPPPTGARPAEGEWARLLSPPRPPTRLIGREREVAEIAFALRSGRSRLFTLTGPGGVGKTRLAIAAAEALAEAFPDGVAWVELAHIAAPPEAAASRVAAAIAGALGVREAVREPVAAPVAEAIGSRRVLLILDNVEHLLGAAPLIAELLAECPRLAVLATSRERLGLRGEREFAVSPLEAPTPLESRQGLANGLAGVAAVRLFVERATEVRGDFSLTAANASAVGELCRRLDGLPLAIELAVGWLKILSPEALAAQLAPRLPLLTGGAADLPDRQRTMRDTIAWSHGLLSAEEQRFFRRLGVFAGGFTLEAAQWVSGVGDRVSDDGSEVGMRKAEEPIPDPRPPTPETLVLVGALVDKSLVRPLPAAASDATPRFGMLETIREFALEQLVASGEAEATRAAHAAYVVDLVETLIPALGGGAQEAGWIERLAVEVPNLRVVLARAVERGEAAIAVRLAEAWQLLSWSSRADSAEALRWLEAALAIGSGGAAARVHALIAAASLVGLRGDFPRAAALAEEGLAVSHANDYPFGVAYALFYRGVVEKWTGDLDAAAASLEEAIVRWRPLDEPYWVALAQNNLADIAFARGDIAGAGVLAAEGLAGSRAVGDAYGAALNLGTLAAVTCARGELARAVELYKESRAVWSSLGDQRGVAGALGGLAGVAATEEDYPRAARLLGAAAALGETVGVAVLVHHERYERTLAATRAGLDAATFDAAWAAGRTLSPEGIAALVTEFAPAQD
jgi:predicted ATPase/transcriptional regulator with XRE-family HTH domain